MVDWKDMSPSKTKVTSAKSGAHMVAKASRMASKVHPKATSADKFVHPTQSTPTPGWKPKV